MSKKKKVDKESEFGTNKSKLSFFSINQGEGRFHLWGAMPPVAPKYPPIFTLVSKVDFKSSKLSDLEFLIEKNLIFEILAFRCFHAAFLSASTSTTCFQIINIWHNIAKVDISGWKIHFWEKIFL